MFVVNNFKAEVVIRMVESNLKFLWLIKLFFDFNQSITGHKSNSIMSFKQAQVMSHSMKSDKYVVDLCK